MWKEMREERGRGERSEKQKEERYGTCNRTCKLKKKKQRDTYEAQGLSEAPLSCFQVPLHFPQGCVCVYVRTI